MTRSKQSRGALLVAVLAGSLIGFALPHFRSATAAPVIAADGDQTSCSCQTLSCTTSEGSRNLSAGCQARCPEGKAPDCRCGKCGDDGSIKEKNVCGCKAAE